MDPLIGSSASLTLPTREQGVHLLNSTHRGNPTGVIQKLWKESGDGNMLTSPAYYPQTLLIPIYAIRGVLFTTLYFHKFHENCVIRENLIRELQHLR